MNERSISRVKRKGVMVRGGRIGSGTLSLVKEDTRTTPRLSTWSKRVPAVRLGNGKRLGSAAQSKGTNSVDQK